MAVVSLSAVPAAAATPTGTSDAASAAVPISSAEVRDYTWFSKKSDRDAHAGVVKHVQRLIDAASPGATLSLTLYYFDRPEIVTALRGAAKRGVHVRVVVDGAMVHPTNQYYKGLKAIPSAKVVECDPRRSGKEPVRGCMSNRIEAKPLNERPVMHNKFMTISQVKLRGGKTARNVLYVSSANLDHYRAYESALTVSHAGLYQGYLTYFNDLMRYGKDQKVNNDYGKTFPAGAHRIYTFPRKESGGKPSSSSNDPIADVLRNTTCAPSGRTRIDLANFRIARRGVVDALVSAARTRGCQVRIVTGDGSMPGVPILDRVIPVRHCGHTPAGGIPVHEKFFIVRQGSQTTLYVGSQNLTNRGLRQNDEAILALRNHPVTAAYQKRFDYLHGECNHWEPGPDAAPATDPDGAEEAIEPTQ
ncbi:phospholipase D-like domain-containing protein [Streptomyces sp. SCA3-4]|uniref:phospholipase D-like domain-containing protein n=1 Tax=Streptomyces sichuanensis TaxID=2871810 RepID=UPI001CE27CDD|nr:phospholipase D-like domain-containing protein [Streptomyces sichuanensis]MCA6091367.1 phospholipase D-like domain-containing protein [Streptomyces sichuanensis]